jgi:hypothetical protein
MANGGIVGINNDDNSLAKGIWSLSEQTVLKMRGKWASDGLSAGAAGVSAAQIKLDTGTTTDGAYWINLPTVGPTQVYCLMDPKWDGGGWMMAMKATRGNTFNYDSTHWTTATTLNATDVTRSDADAKFNIMNYFAAKDMLAVFPDIGAGGSLPSVGNWTWLQNNYNAGTRTAPITFFATGTQTYFMTGKSYSGWGSGTWSSQAGIGWYGYNFTQYTSAKMRWGFAWNNEADLTSNDVAGGIGFGVSNIGGVTATISYSAGDYVGCCPDTTGINRSARVEVYVR